MTATPKKSIKKRPQRTAPAPKAAEPITTGDTLEYSISVEVRGPNGTSWVKAGVIAAVRSGETAAQAEERITSYVEATVLAKAEAIRQGTL